MDEVFRVAVLRVISQMHECLFEVFFLWSLIFFGAKTGKTLIADECLEWIDASYNHVDSKVKLELIEGQWLRQITLHGDVFAF